MLQRWVLRDQLNSRLGQNHGTAALIHQHRIELYRLQYFQVRGALGEGLRMGIGLCRVCGLLTLVAALAGCYQVQIKGPVGDATIVVTELGEDDSIVAATSWNVPSVIPPRRPRSPAPT